MQTGSEVGALLVDGLGDGIAVACPSQDLNFLRNMSFGVLQGSRMRNTKTGDLISHLLLSPDTPYAMSRMRNIKTGDLISRLLLLPDMPCATSAASVLPSTFAFIQAGSNPRFVVLLWCCEMFDNTQMHAFPSPRFSMICVLHD